MNHADQETCRPPLFRCHAQGSVFEPAPLSGRGRGHAGSARWEALALPSAALATTKINGLVQTGPYHDLGNEKPSPKATVTSYNNFYEFGTGKEDPSQNAPKWKVPTDWTIRIEGEVMQPKTLSLDQVMKLAPPEERIYRHRCVERWSIVVPWIGFSLSTLLKQVQPTGKAKYVAFETYYDPKAMLSPREAGIPFPYVEGLRLDEAMHPLDAVVVRNVRRDPAESERRAHPAGDPVEIRLQEHQVDHPHPLRRETAAHGLGTCTPRMSMASTRT